MPDLFSMAPLVSFLLSLAMGFGLSRLAGRVGLVDVPNARKQHNHDVPLVGGLCIYTGVVISAIVWVEHFAGMQVLLAVAGGVLLLGLIDDLTGLSARIRFLGQGIAVSAMIWIAGVQLEDLGQLFGDEALSLGVMAIPITLFCGIGVMNAINLSDGIDGLAGLLVMIALTAIAILCLQAGRLDTVQFIMLWLTAMVAFLLFNLGQMGGLLRQLFLGDAGSLCLGFVLAWLCIDLSQGADRVFAPVTAVWLLAMPLLDTVYVIIRRIRQGRSPVAPGRDHLHHCLIHAGLNKWAALAVIVALALTAATTGVMLHDSSVAESHQFYLFLGVSLCYWLVMDWAWKRRAHQDHSPRLRPVQVNERTQQS